jgi:hypothetical protein
MRIRESSAKRRCETDGAFMHILTPSMPLGMKTERRWTELSGATFVFIFLCGSRNKYINTRNKYENGYFRKQTWNKYGANTDEHGRKADDYRNLKTT